MRRLGNVREGARECSRGGEGTFVRDEGTFARGDLQGHRKEPHLIEISAIVVASLSAAERSWRAVGGNSSSS